MTTRRDGERQVDDRLARTACPGIRPRTSASAVNTPNIAFSGTAIAVTWSVREKARMAAGVVMDSHTATKPGSKVL